MAEPIATTAVAGAAGLGLGSVIATTLGVDPQSLFFSLWGATIGLTFAARAPLPRSVAVFCGVVIASAAFAQWLSVAQFRGEAHARNALACGLAIMFHPLLNSAVTLIQPVLRALLRRIGIELPPEESTR